MFILLQWSAVVTYVQFLYHWINTPLISCSLLATRFWALSFTEYLFHTFCSVSQESLNPQRGAQHLFVLCRATSADLLSHFFLLQQLSTPVTTASPPSLGHTIHSPFFNLLWPLYPEKWTFCPLYNLINSFQDSSYLTLSLLNTLNLFSLLQSCNIYS